MIAGPAGRAGRWDGLWHGSGGLSNGRRRRPAPAAPAWARRAGGRGIGSGLPPGPAACYTGRMAKKRKQAEKPSARPPRQPIRRRGHEGDRRPARRTLPARPRDPRRGPGPGLAGGQYGHGRRLLGSRSRHRRGGAGGQGRADYGKRVIEGLSQRLRAEFGKGYDRSNLFATCGRSSWPTRKSTQCVDNYPGPTTGSCSASTIPTRGHSTRPRRSTPAGPPASWSGRSTRSSSSGWP